MQLSSSMKRFLHIAASLAILVSCGEKSEPQPQPGGDSRKMELKLSEETISWRACGFNVSVDANFEYKVVIDADWIKPDDGMESTASVQYFLADENPQKAERTATLKFQDVNDRYYAKTVTVTQAANESGSGIVDPRLTLSIVDKNATPQTKALLANLYEIGLKGIMFGHHDDLWYGRYWYNEKGRSDTKEVCGDYPAVLGIDFAAIADNRHGDKENDYRRRVVLEAYERGEVIIAVLHLNNPQTGSDSWDNSDKTVVKNILTEGNSTRKKYLTWLDNLADFLNNLKSSNGELVPVILRPYHEHTQNWSWWGSSCTTDTEFTNFWQFTIKYLRDTKGVHNALYCISPQTDSWYGDRTEEHILFRWPGDDWVDYIGIDCYHGYNPRSLSSYLDALDKIAEKKKKPCGITEDGKEGFDAADYWTSQVLNPTKGHRASMVCMWRNKYVGTNESDKHFFSVYPGHVSEADFKKFYADESTFFSKDLPDMYTMPEGVVVK